MKNKKLHNIFEEMTQDEYEIARIDLAIDDYKETGLYETFEKGGEQNDR